MYLADESEGNVDLHQILGILPIMLFTSNLLFTCMCDDATPTSVFQNEAAIHK